MPKPLRKKVLVYCVRDGRLLVFRRVDCSWQQVGLQVPGGSIVAGETVESAALRELKEETGYRCFAVDGSIGNAWYDISPYRSELQERHFVRAHPTGDLPERWISQEDHDGTRPHTRFECFWIPLTAACPARRARRYALAAGRGSVILNGACRIKGWDGGQTLRV